MRTFSQSSTDKLNTCDERLQRVFLEVIKYYDCTVVCGNRNEFDQNEAYRTGKSKLMFPKSKHNSYPSLAVDVVPFPIDWNDKQRFFHFAGYVLGVAQGLGVKIRWGGDWNSDLNFKNDSFIDMPHFELVD